MSKEINSIDELRFDREGLIPAVVQDAEHLDVLMLAYMSRESLQKSLETGQTWFYSRSRRRLWNKGETSGNIQKIESIRYDCDEDTLLVMVRQQGNVACHENMRTCFHNELNSEGKGRTLPDYLPHGGIPLGNILGQVDQVVADRKRRLPEGSYTTYLFEQGIDKILKKLGEECTETVIAAKNRDSREVAYEVSDLFYHLLVMLEEQEVSLEDVAYELKKRR